MDRKSNKCIHTHAYKKKTFRLKRYFFGLYFGPHFVVGPPNPALRTSGELFHIHRWL